MEIREARPEHTDAICRVGTAAWHEGYDAILDPETVTEFTDEWYSHAQVCGYFEEPDLSIFVAGEPVVGFAFCRPGDDGDRLHLTSLYVHPDRWGEGIGSALLARVETVGRDLGLDAVQLVVLDANERGRAFYQARGYEQVREREESIDDRVRELVYETAL